MSLCERGTDFSIAIGDLPLVSYYSYSRVAIFDPSYEGSQ